MNWQKLKKNQWGQMVKVVDELFPKGVNKERGKAIVLLAKILIILKLKR